MGITREVLLDIGNWVQALGLIPSAYFVLSYGVIRPVRFRHRPEVEKWWQTGTGSMFFLLGFAFLASNLVVFATLFFGSDYPGREFVRLAGYSLTTISIYWLCVVYAIESRSPNMKIMNRATRERRRARELAGKL